MLDDHDEEPVRRTRPRLMKDESLFVSFRWCSWSNHGLFSLHI
jgi:hypothetical protein